MAEYNSYPIRSGSKTRSKSLGYKPATVRKDDVGGFGGAGRKPQPKGRQIGMNKRLRKIANRIMRG